MLETGALPIIRSAESPKEALTSYVQLYLKEEIQAEAATRNLAGFARFLPIADLAGVERRIVVYQGDQLLSPGQGIAAQHNRARRSISHVG